MDTQAINSLNQVNFKDTQSSPNPLSASEVLALAYLYLMQAADIQSQTAIIHAKKLQQNALSQQKLNNNGAKLQWAYVPKEDIEQHKIQLGGTWHTRCVLRGKWVFVTRYQTFKYKFISVCKNQTLIANAQDQNQQIVGERQVITEKLNVLQQGAQIQETHINNVNSESSQTIQQGTFMLDILQKLTYSALLRPPVS